MFDILLVFWAVPSLICLLITLQLEKRDRSLEDLDGEALFYLTIFSIIYPVAII